MIVVFVVDTSPSMGKKVDVSSLASNPTGTNSITRLDLAKMTVESLTKSLDKRIRTANTTISPGGQRTFVPSDQFLLLSTSRQERGRPGTSNDNTAGCGAGGRLLVGYGDSYSSGSAGSAPATGSGNSMWSDGSSSGEGAAYPMAGGPNSHGEFEHELKRLNAAILPDAPPPASAAGSSSSPFPDHAGGAKGLNAALSQGLQLLQRYRLKFRSTENFGLGRLPCASMTAGGVAPNAANALGGGGHQAQGGGPKQPAGGGLTQQQLNANVTAVGHALQPACLILLTDAECLASPPDKGGGDLKLQFGSLPLREFYKEPFRWDQRVFCLQVSGVSSSSSESIALPSSLRMLCEVTGGGYVSIRYVSQLPYLIDTLVKTMAPPRPSIVPIPDPLRLPSLPPPSVAVAPPQDQAGSVFLNGGPVCTFQPMERGMNGEVGPIHRAMLMNVPFQPPMLLTNQEKGADPAMMPLIPSHLTDPNSTVNVTGTQLPPPVWCIPEAYWPSKKMDTLPPRQAQPLLQFSRSQGYQMIGSNTVDSFALMKQIHRYDQLLLLNKSMTAPAITQTSAPSGGGDSKSTTTITAHARLLQRDVYACEWLGKGDLKTSGQQREATRRVNHAPPSQTGQEYFSVGVAGAARPSISEGDSDGSNILYIGILHVPPPAPDSSTTGISTLTLLPPEPQILLPLLLKAAEAENRTMRKAMEKTITASGGTAQMGSSQVAAAASNAGKNVFLEESWKTQFRAYLFRLPPYFQAPMRRALRTLLPPNAHPLLSSEGLNSIMSQCFSRACLQRIQKGEATARDMNERYERTEEEMRRRGVALDQQQPQGIGPDASSSAQHPAIGYGQYDPKVNVSTYLNALRNMPPPWKIRGHPDYKIHQKIKEKELAILDKELGLGDNAEKCKMETEKEESGSERKRGRPTVDRATSKEALLDMNDTEESEVAENDVLVASTALGYLPAECSLAYYESRRRWLFGGSGLTSKGISCEGVTLEGCNVHECKVYENEDEEFLDQPLLALADVGASTCNSQSIKSMGDYRERLQWCRSPIVGFGTNDATGAAATTRPDGSPFYSVQDEAMPISFFDPKTGDFVDSAHARMAARLNINFGNPFREVRGDSIIPEKFLNQLPPRKHRSNDNTSDDSSDSSVEGVGASPRTPPGSPPHEMFLSEGEDEARVLLPRLTKRRKKVDDKKVDSSTAEAPPSPSTKEANKRTEGTVSIQPAPPPASKKQPPPPPPAMKKAPVSNAPEKQRPPPPKPAAPKKRVPPPAPVAEKKRTQPNPPPSATKKNPPTISAARPAASARPVADTNAAQKPPALSESALQNPNSKPNIKLPQGWMTVWSKSQKRWYFFDTRMNKSVWQWPPPGR